MGVIKQVAAAGLMIFMSAVALPALAASGVALGVDPQAEADTGGTVRVLTVGADVFIGDKVNTGPQGQVQIRFSDKTELVVGPNSSLVIQDYLLRDDQSAGKFAINALSGAFRFTTGGAAKDRYVITTPTGTIGVRGTAFDFNVDAAGTTVLLYHGAVLLCNLEKVCVTLDGTCEIGTYSLTESTIIGSAADTTGAQRNALKEQFQYSESQMPLMREFWVEQARQCFNAGFTPPSMNESLAPSGNAPPPCIPDGKGGGCGYNDYDDSPN